MRIAVAALVSALGFSLIADRAAAADLPTVRKAPAAVVAMYNWTGFYAGAHVGYGWATPIRTSA